MKINKYMRIIIASFVTLVICISLCMIQSALFPQLNHSEITFILLLVVSVILSSLFERLIYDFDPSHNGDVSLKKSGKKKGK